MSKQKNPEDYLIGPDAIIEDDELNDAMGNWGLHFCPLDRDCRRFGPSSRLYVHTPWGSLIIAFTWASRTQLWLPWKTRNPWVPEGKAYYSRWFSPIVWHPCAD